MTIIIADDDVREKPNSLSPVYQTEDGIPLRSFGTADLIEFHYATAGRVKLPPVDPVVTAALKSTRQGLNVEPYTIVEGPQYWKAADFQGEENFYKWQYRLTPSDIQEIEHALDALQAKGGAIEDLKSPVDFHLPHLGPRLRYIRDQVSHGQGIFLIRGFPVHRFSKWQTASAFYAFGLYWGNPQPQNNKGHVLGKRSLSLML